MKKYILLSLAAIILSFTSCVKPEEGGKDNPPAPAQEQITIPSTVDVKPVVSPEGGDAKITFTAAAAWTASVISTKADSWVDVNPKSGDPGTAEIKITTTPNDTYVERNATIQIKCGAETKDIVLTQKQLDNITVTTDKVELGVEGGSFTIELKSNIDFSYEIDGDWIKYVSTKAYSDKTLTFSAEPNEGVQKREGSVTVKGGEFSETVKVYQSGEEPTLVISQNEYNLEAEGGCITVEVSSNVAVTMTIPESANWITENQTKSESTSTFYLDVAVNETKEARSAEITFSNEESGLSEKVTVNQKGKIYVPVTDMVDLGLSVKWATCNIGATKPEEYGGYYQWAGLEDVTSTDIYLYLDYYCPYHKGREYTSGWTKYVPSDKSTYWSGSGNPDNKTVLDPEDDIAHKSLGDKWRIPTDEEWRELMNNCNSKWTTKNGINGREFTSKKNGKSIFVPASGYRGDVSLYNAESYGYCWSSSLYTDDPSYGGGVILSSFSALISYDARFLGRTVRPVYGDIGDDKVRVTGVSLEPTSISLNVGEKYTLSATVTPSNATDKTVRWTSSDTDIATVDHSGEVTGVREGSTTITVTTTDGGYTASCSVTVENPGTIVVIATPDAVDLGLSVKWASFNLGANNPEEYGCYYQWAGVEYLPINVEIGDNNCPYFNPALDIFTGWTKYFLSKWSFYMSYSGNPDNKTVLDSDDDVAYVTLGGKWRMPTIEEFEELYNNCIWTLGQLNGIIGYKVTSNMPGYTDKSIFLPAAGLRESTFLNYVGSHGFYWSSSLDKESPFRACGIRFNLDQVDMYSIARSAGISVRPVYGDRKKVTGVSLYPTSLNMDLRETYTLSAAITPSNASEQGVFWTSSDTDVATVDQSGNVTAVKLGSATITVKTVDGGYTATCNVTVVAPTPEAVDLGLSVKWASFNLGATKPLEFGNFYQWAGLEDVTNKSINVDIDNVPYYIGHSWVKYITSNKKTWYSDPASPDNKTVLDPEDDIAHMTLGGKWRMPTKAEWEELIENCIWETYKNSGGTWISVVTSTKPGYTDKYIILPSAGYRYEYFWLEDGSAFYWSSSLYPDNHDGAYICTFKEMYSTNAAYVSSAYRFYGFSIRPVSD